MIGRAALMSEVNHNTTEMLAEICRDLHVCEYFLFRHIFVKLKFER